MRVNAGRVTLSWHAARHPMLEICASQILLRKLAWPSRGSCKNDMVLITKVEINAAVEVLAQKLRLVPGEKTDPLCKRPVYCNLPGRHLMPFSNLSRRMQILVVVRSDQIFKWLEQSIRLNRHLIALSPVNEILLLFGHPRVIHQHEDHWRLTRLSA